MSTRDQRLISERFQRASEYHPEWILAGISGAANPLWLTEWLAECPPNIRKRRYVAASNSVRFQAQ